MEQGTGGWDWGPAVLSQEVVGGSLQPVPMSPSIYVRQHKGNPANKGSSPEPWGPGFLLVTKAQLAAAVFPEVWTSPSEGPYDAVWSKASP